MKFADVLDKAYGAYCLATTPLREQRVLPPPADAFTPSAKKIVHEKSSEGPLDISLQVTSWNAHEGNLPGFLNTLEQLLDNTDILLLQESPHPRSATYAQIPEKLHYIFAPDCYRDVERPSGNIILSKHPITATDTVNLPVVTWEYHKNVKIRRNAVYAQLKIAGGSVGIWNTHLDIYCMPKSRGEQILPMIKKLKQQRDAATVVGMDANAFGTVFGKEEPSLHELLCVGFDDLVRERPRLHFADYVFSRGMQGRAQFFPIENAEPGHLPITARFVLPR